LLACALLVGCASPPSLSPAASPRSPLPTAWSAPLPHAGSTTDLNQWWSRFNDPLLAELIAAAQAASPNLASAWARLEKARAGQVAAVAAGLPQLQVQGAASHGRATAQQPITTSATLGVTAAWEWDLFGALAAGQRAAQARAEGAQAAWHGARISVAAETASSYAALRVCEAQLTLSLQDSQSRNETARLTDSSARAGFTAPAEAALARAGAAQSRSTTLAQRAQCDTLVKSLVEVSDIPEAQLRQRLAQSTGRLPQPEPISSQVLPAALLAQRPDVAEASPAVAAAASEHAQSQARQRPQVGLAGSLFELGSRSGGVSSTGIGWTLGPVSVSFPLFDGGARAANTAVARAAYDEAVALYQAQLRRAVREVETALVALQSTADRQPDTDAAARDFEASLRATSARSLGGLSSQFELEIARRNALQAQSVLVDLQRERLSAWISLYRALGGGWSAEAVSATAVSGLPVVAAATAPGAPQPALPPRPPRPASL